MPIVNGRVHLHHRPLAPRHRVAYVSGVTAAVLLVAVGWVLTVGRQLQDLMAGAKTSIASATDVVSQARQAADAAVPTPKIPSPAAFVPALHAALQTSDASASSTLPTASPLPSKP